MAGDWIKVEHALPEKPEVVAIAAALDLDRFAVVGRLFTIWSWFDRHTVDGNARGVTPAFLDSLVDVKGFASALACVGWLETRDGAIRMPNFDRHLSKSAKTRSLGQERLKRFRNAAGVSKPRQRREEKRREEPPLSPLGEEERGRLVELVARQNVAQAAQAVDGAIARGCSAAQIEEAARVADRKALLTLLQTIKPPSAIVRKARANDSAEDKRLRIIAEHKAAGIDREETNRVLIENGLEGIVVPSSNGSRA